MTRLRKCAMRCLLIGFVCWLQPTSVSAQGNLNNLTDQLTRQSVTSTIFPLADGLMLASSFDEVAKQLNRQGFTKVELEHGLLKAESPLCSLRAVNRRQRPEQIDTLTLYLRRSLNRDILKDSLGRAGYTFMETSADQRYDWYKRADGINLAVYYVYKEPYKSAMLFARPTSSSPTPVATPTALTFKKPLKAKVTTSRDDGGQFYALVNFPVAEGGPAATLNAAAIASSLLSSLVSTPLARQTSVTDGLKAFLHQVKVDFLATTTAAGDEAPLLEVLYDVTVQPADATREGVITYVNHVTASDHGQQFENYRVAANFDATTGRQLTFDDVFIKQKRATIIELLRVAHQSMLAEHPDCPVDVDVTAALDNFILGCDHITFLLTIADGERTYEEVLSYEYSNLQQLLR